MGDLRAWAEERWARRAEPDETVVQVGGEELTRARVARELDRLRETLYADLGALGAEPEVLRHLDAFEAAAGLLGVVVGASQAPRP